MSRSRRRRYELDVAELNQMIDALVARARDVYGSTSGVEHVRQMVVSAIRMLEDGSSSGDTKLVNSALKELRHAFRVFAPYEHVRKVAVFGSARTPQDHSDWRAAFEFSERMASLGWMTITGAGPGIMMAANGGAGREASFGVNIRLPFEQQANEVIAGDRKLINFRYFFTRKVIFVKEAHAIALFPGGFGTHDEGFEALTLIQTGKSEILPVVFIDSAGGSYWRDWEAYVHEHLGSRGLIGESDLALFCVTDDIEVATQHILGFYDNYHSSRYVDDLLVIRLHRAPDGEELDALNREFSGILASGRIEVTPPLAREDGEMPHLPRVTLHFNRRDVGGLRRLIDRLNQLVPEHSSPDEAVPHQIVEGPLSPEAENAERE